MPNDVPLARTLCLEFKRIEKDASLNDLNIFQKALRAIRNIFEIKPETVQGTELELRLIEFLILTLTTKEKPDVSYYEINDIGSELLLKLHEDLQSLLEPQQLRISRAVSLRKMFLTDALKYVSSYKPKEELKVIKFPDAELPAEEGSASEPQIKRPRIGY